MEIQYVPLAQARRGNRSQVEEWLATYTRLFGERAALGRRLADVGGDDSSTSPTPEHLRKRLERHFAPGLDGFKAVAELREAKAALEDELTRLRGLLKETIEGIQRRFRELRKDIEQTAGGKSTLCEFIEQACLGDLSVEQQHGLRNLVQTELRSWVLPGSLPEMSPTAETVKLLEVVEAEVQQARAVLHKAENACQQEIERIQKARNEAYRQKIAAKLAGTAKTESLQEFLPRHKPTSTLATSAEDKAQRKLDTLLAEVVILESTAGWQAIQKRAEKIRRETDPGRRLILYEALVLDCGQHVRRLREHERWAREMDELIDRAMVHASQPAVQVICEALRQTRRAGNCIDLNPLSVRLDQALASSRKAAEREEKRRLLLQALQGMGYEIVEGLETALQAAGRIVVQRDGETEYAVEMVVNDDLSLVQTAMVRFGESGEATEQQQLRDKEKEESWCQDHSRMREKLAQHGLKAALKMHVKPGEHPVRVVPGGERLRSSRTSARRTGQRQRSA